MKESWKGEMKCKFHKLAGFKFLATRFMRLEPLRWAAIMALERTTKNYTWLGILTGYELFIDLHVALIKHAENINS